MTEPIDLDAAQALADAATPGPWTVTPPVGNGWTAQYWAVGTESDGLLERFTGDIGGNLTNTQADAEFIAQARTLVPLLVTEVQRLRGEIDRAYGQRDLVQRLDSLHVLAQESSRRANTAEAKLAEVRALADSWARNHAPIAAAKLRAVLDGIRT